ncbi:hypothetical protein VNO77_10533 [Canavalia gladiata]|uniref:Uncharacterized protein n=1 Tax=Canavalia gladiata TaxID=3824 RepID=A0AAN9MAI4_CANGL
MFSFNIWHCAVSIFIDLVLFFLCILNGLDLKLYILSKNLQSNDWSAENCKIEIQEPFNISAGLIPSIGDIYSNGAE